MAAGWRWTRKRIRLRNLCGRTSLLSLSRWNHGPCRCIPAGWVPSGGILQNSRWHEEKWAHPVISEGLLYLRGLNKILCYDVRDPTRAVVPAPVNRVWTDSTGRFKVEARLKGVNQGKAILEKSDGSVFEISLDRLSLSDQAYLRSL